MGNGVFNAAKGRLAHFVSLPAASDALVVVLLKAAGLEPDDALNNHTSLAAVLAASNDEADFTNYTRRVVTDPTVSIDNTANAVDVDMPDQAWPTAGGAVNNQLGKLLICYRPDLAAADGAVVPLVHLDAVVSTDGTDLVAEVASSGVCRVS